jgi:Peptidase inhibitor family I36
MKGSNVYSISEEFDMKKLSFRAATFLMLIGLVPLSQAAPQFGTQRNNNQRDRVCFYKDIHFQGWEDCYSPGDEVGDLKARKNAISSIRIYGRARVTVYDNTSFRGTSSEFSSDVPDLGLRSSYGSHTWNDRIDSFQISGERGFVPSPPAPPPSRGSFPFPQARDPEPREGICLYENANYQGRSQCYAAGTDIRDLGRVSRLNDRITSIRIFGGVRAVLYRDIMYRGESVVLDRNIPNLGIVRLRGGQSWNDQISSIEVTNGRGRGRGRPFRFR